LKVDFILSPDTEKVYRDPKRHTEIRPKTMRKQDDELVKIAEISVVKSLKENISSKYHKSTIGKSQ